MSLKLRLKNFFKARESSEEAVELLRMFILPFSRKLKKTGVDDTIAAFFGIDDRKIVWAKARRNFRMPGKYLIAGNRPLEGYGPSGVRNIRKRQTLLLAVDRDIGRARVELEVEGKSHSFQLERFEFETLKDWVEVLE